ncbi:MAG: hypothetical protein Q8L41_01015 [Anaerolineales bacterium]|nr:hypothetical protein [Anaerolineales bacterium]
MSSLFLMLIFLDRVFRFARHERNGFLLEDTQTGAGVEIDSLAAIQGTWIICWVFEFASTDVLYSGH